MILLRVRRHPSDAPIWGGPYDGCFVGDLTAARGSMRLPCPARHDEAGRLIVVPLGTHERYEWRNERYQWVGTRTADSVDA